MSPNYKFAIPLVLAHEGGFVDDPVDPGGATNYGISLRWLRKVGDLVGDLDGDGDVDADDIAQMTRADAERLYQDYFWSDWYDKLDRNVAYRLFDMRVNAGPKTAHRCIQRAARAHGYVLKEDGLYGSNTHMAVAAIGDKIIPTLRSERAAFYRILIAKNPDFEKYRGGWLNRAYS